MKLTKKDKQMKIIKWLSLLLFFSVFILGISRLIIKDSKAVKESVSSSEVYPGLNLQTTKQKAENYSLFISQPVSENKALNDEINQWIQKERNDFAVDVKNAKDFLQQNNFKARLNIETETNKLGNQLYNLELTSYQMATGANGQTKTKAFIIDLKNHKILKTKDLFKSNKKQLTELQELIYQEIEKKSEFTDYLFEEELKKSLAHYEEWDLSLYSDHISLLFDQYEVAAGAAGDVKIDIPIDNLTTYLKPHFLDKIGVEREEEPQEDEPKEVEDKTESLESGGKYIALTFDDGPHIDVTPRVLKTLEEYQAKATFYMLGNQVNYYPSLVEEVLEAGHEIGNHSKSHKDLTHLANGQIQKEIQSTNQSIQKASGQLPKSIRPPYGASNDSIEAFAKKYDLPIVMWSVDSLDWQSRDPDAINQEVMANVYPGAIVLLHDIHSTTADALPRLLNQLEKEGYEFVRVSQLLELAEQEGVGPHYQIDLDENN